MKKILLPILLVLAMAFLLTGCGQSRSDTPATQAQTSQQTVADSQPVAEGPAQATVAQVEQEGSVADSGDAYTSSAGNYAYVIDRIEPMNDLRNHMGGSNYSISLVGISDFNLLRIELNSGQQETVFSFTNPKIGQNNYQYRYNAPNAFLSEQLVSHQMRHLFNSDFTRFAVGFAVDGEDHVGWIDRNMNLTDITAQFATRSTSFESTTIRHVCPMFLDDGRFFYSDYNGEKYCYVDPDTMQMTSTEMSQYSNGEKIKCPMTFPDGFGDVAFTGSISSNVYPLDYVTDNNWIAWYREAGKIGVCEAWSNVKEPINYISPATEYEIRSGACNGGKLAFLGSKPNAGIVLFCMDLATGDIQEVSTLEGAGETGNSHKDSSGNFYANYFQVIDVASSTPEDTVAVQNYLGVQTNSSGNNLTPAEYAYLSGYCNAAVEASNDGTEIADIFYRLIQQNVPAEHPIAQLDRTDIHAYVGGSNRDMEAIVINYDYSAIVVFSGTHGDADIRTDIGIVADTSPAWVISAIGNAFNTLFSETPYEAAHTLLADLGARYNDIIVCGHSLGGHLAVDVTLSFDVINACYAFDPPGRGDALIHDVVNSGREQKIVNYCAEGSYVSMTGTQVGTVNKVAVTPNMSGTDNIILTNHGIYEIAEALGGSWGRETRNVETVSLPEEGPRNTDLVDGSANSGDINIALIQLNGHTFDLSKPFNEVIREAVDSGYNVVNGRALAPYNADGTIQQNDEAFPDYSDYRSITFYADTKRFDDCESNRYTFDGDVLSTFLTADNIYQYSSLENIPAHCLYLPDIFNPDRYCYATLIKDSAPWDIQEIADRFPTSIDMEMASNILNNRSLSSAWGIACPQVFQSLSLQAENLMNAYNGDPEFRNNVLVTQAIYDAYLAYQKGEIHNMGVIYYRYTEGVLNECDIVILRE